MRRAPEPLRSKLAEPSLSVSGGVALRFHGRMRVLVVDDQRTMRQMVATLFQRLCQEHRDLAVEVHTALSGEQAVRQAATRHYHIITMDEQLSESYCRAVAKEHADASREKGAAVAFDADGLPAPLVFGSDRITNAQRRLAFFDAELAHQRPLEGDGALAGHEAIAMIRTAEKNAERAPAVIFNLTGNVLECDRTKYAETGSNGVLPKPTKLVDLQNLLCLGMPDLLAKGICEKRGPRVFMHGDLQIGDVSPPA